MFRRAGVSPAVIGRLARSLRTGRRARRSPAAGETPALLLFLLLFALSAHADNFGPINVLALQSLGDAANAGYNVRRFDIENPTHDSHKVTLTIVVNGYGMRSELHTSRTFTAPAGSTITVEIPEQMQGWAPSRELAVEVDGRHRGPDMKLPTTGSGERGMQILLSPSFTDTVLREQMKKRGPSPNSCEFIRSEVPIRQWSTNWLAYTPFVGVAMTTAEWAELPAATQLGVQRWVRSGGTLLIAGAPLTLPGVKTIERNVPGYTENNLAFGRVFLVSTPIDAAPEPLFDALSGSWQGSQQMTTTTSSPMELLPLLGSSRVPVAAMFTLLIVFAVSSGPISLFMHAKKNRRLWIFWSMPAAALIASAGIVLASLASEGWQRVMKSSSITYLDENSGEATTIGVIGFYATLPPNGEIRFSPDTEFRLFGDSVHLEEVDATDGQKLSGWVDSRVSTYFAFRKNEHRRERLSVQTRNGQLVAVNGFGSRISTLWLVADDGTVYRSDKIEPGAESALHVAQSDRLNEVQPVWLGSPDAWVNYPSRWAAEPASMLRRGGYIAVLDSSPFVERALEHPRTTSTNGVVLGVLKRGGNES